MGFYTWKRFLSPDWALSCHSLIKQRGHFIESFQSAITAFAGHIVLSFVLHTVDRVMLDGDMVVTKLEHFDVLVE